MLSLPSAVEIVRGIHRGFALDNGNPCQLLDEAL